MKILSIHVGKPRQIPWQGKEILTSIFKDRVEGPVMVAKLNIEGDGQADFTVHGGLDKAVYAYSADAYWWWKKTLGVTELPEGAFGENLTVSQLDETKLCLGDRLKVGSVELEVCQPRLPCFKLGIRFNDMGILKTFMKSERPGIYFRVLREGQIAVGDRMTVVFEEPQRIPLVTFFLWKHRKVIDKDLAKRALKIAGLNEDWKRALEEFLG
jgi:MOSC domain-containing protein YiiM